MSFPFWGEKFTFTQPDGSQIEVRGWGDQRHAVFETLDGFTIVKEPITGFYQYAALSADGEELDPSGVQIGIMAPRSLGLAKGLRINRDAAKASAEMSATLPPTKSRWEVRRERYKTALQTAMSAPEVLRAPPQRETTGTYIGLCLLIQFPDVPGTIPVEKVAAFCNQPGYTGFGNKGSVYDYFYDNSGGKLRYTNIVAPYYTAKYPRAYYTDPKIPQPKRAWQLIKEALTALRAQGFDFSQLTVDDEDYLFALNVFYAGSRVNNWAEGLWPHSYHLLTPFKLMPGKRAFDYQITDMGSQLTLGTFCHENGHMICDFPDLYDYGYESRGTGVYCLMCAGGSVDKTNPTNVCAYLKYKAGWAKNITPITTGMSATIKAGENDFFIYRKHRAEYFIIENRNKAQRDLALPASGLAIWHVDELGSNNNEAMTPTSHYECSLEQADGQFHLEHGVGYGDEEDLFVRENHNRFTTATQPDSKWWDRSGSGLDIYNVSSPGKTMTFSANL